MKIELTDAERRTLTACINTTIKVADDAISTSNALLPLVAKLNPPEKPEPVTEEPADG